MSRSRNCTICLIILLLSISVSCYADNLAFHSNVGMVTIEPQPLENQTLSSWTIEGYYKADNNQAHSDTVVLFQKNDLDNELGVTYHDNGGDPFLRVTAYDAGDLHSFNLDFDIDDYSWHHIVLQAADDTLKLFIDGFVHAFSSQFSSHTFTGTDFTINGRQKTEGQDQFFYGCVDNFRVSDTLRYSGDSYSTPNSSFEVDSRTELTFAFNEHDGYNTLDKTGSFTGTCHGVYGSGYSWIAGYQAILQVPSVFNTIQLGLNAAAEGDTVLVEPGTYYENIVWPSIEGIALVSSGDSSNTIIDGMQYGSVIDIRNLSVKYSLIDNFKVRNGANVLYGGGLFLENSSIKIARCSFESCLSMTNGGGGGLAATDTSEIIVENCSFINNNVSSNGHGGAILISKSKAVITYSFFQDNSAASGGAIEYMFPNLGDTLKISNSEFQANTSNGSHSGGGAISLSPSCISLIDESSFFSNTATGSNNFAGGGAISLNHTKTLISNSTFQGNFASNYGGSITSWSDSLVVENCDFFQHDYQFCVIKTQDTYGRFLDVVAQENGGSVFYSTEGDTLIITGLVATDNHTGLGCGVRSDQGSYIEINNSTISDNIADIAGGAIYNKGTIKIYDTLLKSNEAMSGGAISTTGECYSTNNDILWNSAVDGGGIFGPAIIDNSVLMYNSANTGGGGYELSTISNSIIADNSANIGGGLYNPEYAELTGFYNNSAEQGGAIYGYAKLLECTISGSNGGAVYSTEPDTIQQCNFFSNSEAIFNQVNIGIFPAQNNFWGDPTGPYHPFQNTTGLGDSVNHYVDVTPWLTAPDPDAPPISPSNIVTSNITRREITLSWDTSLLPDLAGYRVYIDSDSAGYPYTDSVNVGTDTSFTFVNLLMGETYYMAVTTYDTDGNQSWYSQDIEATTGVPIVLNVPGEYPTIQAGLNAATELDTVLVAPGIYNEILFWPSVNGIFLTSSGDSSNTVIDGQQLGPVVTFPADSTIDTNTVITKVTLQNGSAASGGGIYCYKASPKIYTVYIKNNQANDYGAGLYCKDSSPTFFNVTIENNSTISGKGGGIYCLNSSARFINVLVNNNDSQNGGGIYCDMSSTEFSSCIVTDNSSTQSGGGGLFSRSTTILFDVTISENNSDSGGGIYLYESPITISSASIIGNSARSGGGVFCANLFPPEEEITASFTEVTISGNTAIYNGGGVNCSSSWSIFSNVVIMNNTAGENGGGMYFDNNSNSVITNVEIRNNSSENGGGFYCDTPFITQTNVVIENNVASQNGGGIYCYGYSTFSNTRISNNEAINFGGGIYSKGSPIFLEAQLLNNIANNGQSIFIGTNSAPTINYTTIVSNDLISESYAIYSENGSGLNVSGTNFSLINRHAVWNCDNTVSLDADSCWWGDSSGPYHPIQNTTGLGDSVNHFVDVTPWMTTPDVIAPPIPPIGLELIQAQSTSLSVKWDRSPLSDASYYKLYFDTDSTGYPYANSIDVGLDTSYTLTELAPLTTHYIAITVMDTADNESWYSQELQATTRTTEAQNLSLVSVSDTTHVLSHSPTIQWRYIDSMGQPQGAYEVQTSTYSDFSSLDAWNPGWVSSADTSVVYAGNPLLDGETYYLRVRVQAEDEFIGPWSTLSFRMNSRPSMPGLLAPSDNSILTIAENLMASSSVDSENDTISYGFLIYSDSSKVNLIRNIADISDTTWQVTPELPDDQMYWWTCHAHDGYESSDTSDTWSFLLNMQDDPPHSFSLISPDTAATCLSGDTTLVWNKAHDPDYNDSVYYVVLFSRTADFSSNVDSLITPDTSIFREHLMDNTTYWWKVRAQDTNTSGTWSSETWSFNVGIPEEPNSFTLLTPSNGVVLPSDTVTVTWSSASDPDLGNNITYNVQWSTDPTFTTFYSGATVDTFFTITDLEDVVEGFVQEDPSSGRREESVSRKEHSSNSKSLLSGKTKTTASSGLNIGSLTSGTSGSALDAIPDDNTIYWRVYAEDSDGLVTWALPGPQGWSFSVYLSENPLPFSLVGPDSGSVCSIGDTTLVWHSNADPDPDDVISYVVYLSTDEGFTEVDSVEVTDTTYTVRNLLDDTTYWWKVRAQDTNTSGTWSNEVWSFEVAIPEAPEPFTLISPVNGLLSNVDVMEFRWTRAMDNDPGDLITYEFQYSNAADFADYDTLLVNDTTCFLESLEDDMIYFWRVLAFDSYGLTRWSMAGESGWSFEVDIPQPPLPFSLTAPDSGLVLDTLAATFEWENTIDPDPGNEVSFVLSLSMVEDFEDTMTVHYSAEAETSFPVPYMQDDTDYWWRVIAADDNGNYTLSNETWTFHTAWPEPPHPFEVNEGAIAMNDTGDSVVVSLTWQRTWDPDPESLEYYAVLLDTTEDMNIPIILADSVMVSGMDTTFTWSHTYAPEELPMLGDGFWTVYAYDNNTEGTWADNVMAIFVTSVDDSPWGSLPVEYEFAAVYPNPFNPTLTAVISLPHPSKLTVQVFNVMGQRVATIAEGHYQEGFHSFVFDGQKMASGVYFVIANVPGKLNQVKKVVLMK